MSQARRLPPLFLSALLMIAAMAASAVAGEPSIADMSLEDLLKIKVTTASRKAQALADVPAAVFVITGEDIQRSGAASIPEALRLAPGVEVAKIANNKWAVSIRGFNSRYANKLLVLMDGRSLYSPLFSGLIWEAEDTLLEDIERIEVIRGPGAAMWGANAVNGVINIITKNARDTQGGLLAATAGSEEGAGTALRYGGRIDEQMHYRVYAKSFDRRASIAADGQPALDTWRAERVGYRLDRESARGGRSTLIAAAYDSRAGDQWRVPVLQAPYLDIHPVTQKNSGASLLGRTEQVLDNGSEWSLRASLASTRLAIDGLGEARNTLDLDFQYRLQAAPAHDLMWGLNYRYSSDQLTSTAMLSTTKPSRRLSFAGLFVQDDVSLLPDTLKATLGARLEQRSGGHPELQPNLRLLWTLSQTQSLWASASRALRTPSRSELDFTGRLAVIAPFSAQNPSPLPILVQTAPGSAVGFGDEQLDALELGWRKEFTPNLSLDASIFGNRYSDLRGGSPPTAPVLILAPTAHLVSAMVIDNSASAGTHGLEARAEWRPHPGWRLQGGLSLFRARLSSASSDHLYASNSPGHQASLRSSMNLSEGRQFDATIKRVGQLQAGLIPAYTRLDLRYAWKPVKNLELALVGQNLLDARHREFIRDYLPSQEVEVQRSIYLKAEWQL